jgi:hypothetical protein
VYRVRTYGNRWKVSHWHFLRVAATLGSPCAPLLEESVIGPVGGRDMIAVEDIFLLLRADYAQLARPCGKTLPGARWRARLLANLAHWVSSRGSSASSGGKRVPR